MPTLGMHAIPMQIATELPKEAIRLKTTVESVSDGSVKLSDGETLSADHIIIATEEPAAKRILANGAQASGRVAQLSSIVAPPNVAVPKNAMATSCLYFEVLDPPIHEATLVLNGEKRGVINNLCFPNFGATNLCTAGQGVAEREYRRGDRNPRKRSVGQGPRAACRVVWTTGKFLAAHKNVPCSLRVCPISRPPHLR